MEDETFDSLENVKQLFNSGQIDLASLGFAKLPIKEREHIPPEVNYVHGAIMARYGKVKMAIESLTDAYNSSRRRHDIATYLGNLLLSIGDVDQAAYYLTKALRLRTLEGKEDVVVFGDSHADFCFNGIPRCKVFSFPGITMHRIGRDGVEGLNIRAFGIHERPALVFIFGEVDARGHVVRQRDVSGRTITEIIETLCTNYLRTVCMNRDAAKIGKTIVCSVAPPTFVYNRTEVPSYGTMEERVASVAEYNATLQRKCAENGVIFMDIFKYFHDPCGAMSRSLAGSVHIRRAYSDIIEYELESTLLS